MRLKIWENEYWWGGQVCSGYKFPFDKSTEDEISMYAYDRGCDQYAPLLLSSKGRYVWSELGFVARFGRGIIEIEGKGEILLEEGFETLRGAYLAAMRAHFPFDGRTPDSLFFRAVQYNTWMELETEQTTDNILHYAENILSHGMKPGVLMIDEGWQEDYGVFEFNRRKIPDPGKLIERLHKMGFKVMLWVSPAVSGAGRRFKDLRRRGLLCRDRDGNAGIREWWNGYSAFLDCTNPEAVEWMQGELDGLMEKYGVDGFKLDGADWSFYRDEGITYLDVDARTQTYYYNLLGEKYNFNEYRAAWKFGGRPIVARLHDKHHSWDGSGLNLIIPNSIMQGLAGYAYCCPDMAGGGHIGLPEEEGGVDIELLIRWAFANAMMPMMQISLAPWRILSEKECAIYQKAVKIHEEHGELFAKLAEKAARTGEPVLRHMDYEFPGQGFETVKDQFMIGSDIMAAPVVTKGCFERTVFFPEGSDWISERGEQYEGGTSARVDVPLDRLPLFRRK